MELPCEGTDHLSFSPLFEASGWCVAGMVVAIFPAPSGHSEPVPHRSPLHLSSEVCGNQTVQAVQPDLLPPRPQGTCRGRREPWRLKSAWPTAQGRASGGDWAACPRKGLQSPGCHLMGCKPSGSIPNTSIPQHTQTLFFLHPCPHGV
jgi:hypothetical protein